MHWWQYFTDPVMRAPTLGGMLMGIGSASIGVIAFLRKRSLLGEALSHATYPGVALALLAIALFVGKEASETAIALTVFVGATLAALLGLLLMDTLEQRYKVSSDAALCWVLALFFGIGITISSRIQITHSYFYNQIHSFLYGQPATMTDVHLYLYLALTLVILTIIILFAKEIKAISFDRAFARAAGLPVALIDRMIVILIVIAIVIGIRSVGIILMSSMLIAPAIAARQYTNDLSKMFVIAATLGAASSFAGNYLSVEAFQSIALPTGPLIALVASALCFLSLLFAPPRGIAIRRLRAARFHWHVLEESLLKALCRLQEEGQGRSFKQVARRCNARRLLTALLLYKLQKQKMVTYDPAQGQYLLSAQGQRRALRIIRLHRLWEVYLVDYLGMGIERVHKSAEEIDHIITPDVEEELDRLLKYPQYDPHHKPIPPSSK